MAFTAEQQLQLDMQIAAQRALENERHANQLELHTRQTRLEAVRLAKETLIENARSKPVDSREVTAAAINEFAESLVVSINA
jgi:hypothetical protein